MATIARTALNTHQVRADVRGRDPSAASFATLLALDALLGPRNDLETCDRNPVATRHTQSVGAVGHACQRTLDVVDGLTRARRQREIALALDAHGVALARLLVELRIALFALARE